MDYPATVNRQAILGSASSRCVNGGGVLAHETNRDVMPWHGNLPGGIWRFDASRPAEYQLSGTLRIERPADATDVSQWHGEITIPAVTLVIPGR